VVLVLGIGASLAGGPTAALAQSGESPHRDALFTQMMADPDNVRLALEYARLAADAGDLEGAVSTLERLRIFAPDSAEIQYQLAILYYRLGAFGVAKTYFDAASASPDLSARLRSRIPGYLTSIERARETTRLAGRISMGARYQSNANAGTSNDTIELYGLDFDLSDSAMAQSDVNGFISGIVQYSHDLASQGDRIEASLSAFGAYYHDLDTLNALQAQGRIGPVLDLGRFSIDNSDLKIEALGGIVALAGELYQASFGAAAELRTEFGPTTRGVVRIEARRVTYFDSAVRPNVADRSGLRGRLSARLEHDINSVITAYSSLYAERNHADRDMHRFFRTGVRAGATFAFDGPGEMDANRPWSLDLSAGLDRRMDDVADTIMSEEARRDWTVSVAARLDVPLAESWSLGTDLTYEQTRSNYGLYTMHNVGGSISLDKTF